MSNIKKKKIKILEAVINVVLKRKGIKSVNSKSYKTKNTHNNVKLRLNCMSVSVVTLNPHS